MGPGYAAGLVGVKDMPKGPSRLSLDFSSLLGPLFSMWLLQVRMGWVGGSVGRWVGGGDKVGGRVRAG